MRLPPDVQRMIDQQRVQEKKEQEEAVRKREAESAEKQRLIAEYPEVRSRDIAKALTRRISTATQDFRF